MKADLPLAVPSAATAAAQTGLHESEAAPVAGECTHARGSPAEQKYERLDRAAHAAFAVASGGLSPWSLALAWMDWGLHLAVSPGKCTALLQQAALDLPLSGEALLQTAHAAGALAGRSASRPRAGAMPDPRFAAHEWANWPFCVWRDAFLKTQQWWQDATTGISGVDARHEQLVRFSARQCVDAVAPSNFVPTNPLVIDAAIRTGGANFIAGTQHWAEDLEDWASRLRGEPSKRVRPFVPGRNVAITPGKVVWRNELCELLQYEPGTAQVAREPLLIVPSWIMKYYILDLQPHDSLIRYLVGEGYTVFVVSWRNPGAESRNVGLDDYLSQGMLATLAEVRARCGGEAVHAVGYCLGGTLLAIAAAALARDGREGELRSVTLLAAQTNFSEPGELGLLIDASELAALDALMWEQGFLDGPQMAAAFQLLNARDLIWSRLMSEYLLGRRSKPNDLMAWNADTTRLPYRMHSECLRRLFLDNDLAAGRYCVNGRPVALSDIETPMFVVGTERDHVSPWRSVYQLHLLTHNPLTFVLTAGGHNAGIVSEPGHPGRYYRCATRAENAPYRSRDTFLDELEPVQGSWWPCWSQWLRTQSSEIVDARPVGDGLADAPGGYVIEP